VNKLKEFRAKIREALVSALPITLIVYLVALLPGFSYDRYELISFTVGAVLLVLGIGLFNMGADIAMTPMGTHVAAGLSRQKKLKLLVTVVDRSKSEFYLNVLSQFEVNLQMATSGKGTANSYIIDMPGLNIHKAVLLSVVREDMVEPIMSSLENKFKTILKGKGFAFAVPLSRVIGVNKGTAEPPMAKSVKTSDFSEVQLVDKVSTSCIGLSRRMQISSFQVRRRTKVRKSLKWRKARKPPIFRRFSCI